MRWPSCSNCSACSTRTASARRGFRGQRATRVPGISVAQVARRYEVNANQVFAWRRLADQGLLRNVYVEGSDPVRLRSLLLRPHAPHHRAHQDHMQRDREYRRDRAHGEAARRPPRKRDRSPFWWQRPRRWSIRCRRRLIRRDLERPSRHREGSSNGTSRPTHMMCYCYGGAIHFRGMSRSQFLQRHGMSSRPLVVVHPPWTPAILAQTPSIGSASSQEVLRSPRPAGPGTSVKVLSRSCTCGSDAHRRHLSSLPRGYTAPTAG